MRILVTGVAGLIGSWVAEALVKREDVDRVIGVDDLSGGDIRNVNIIRDRKFTFEHIDLMNKNIITELIASNRPHIIVHAAAIAREGASAFQPVRIAESNYMMSMILLENAIRFGVKKFNFFSSMAVMGNQKPPFDEEMPRDPVDVYGISKAAVERSIEQLSLVHSFDYAIIRPHNCFDQETEILTKDRGFVRFENLTFSDHVATLNRETDQLEWQMPTDIQRMEHDGPMFHFTPKGVDLLVTGDHHLWMKRGKSRGFDFCRADDVSDKDYASEFKGGAGWVGEDIEFKTLPATVDSLGRPDPRNPERKIPMDSWLKLVGWFVSEGSVFATKSNYIVNITNYNEDFKKEIETVIEECGFVPYWNKDTDVRIHSKQLYNEFIGMAGSKNKRIPHELKNLPQKRLRVLFDTLLKGDGSFRRDGSPGHYKTTSATLVDDIEEIGTKLGIRVSHSIDNKVKAKEHYLTCYKVSFASHQTTPQLGDNYQKTVYLEKEHYAGVVYDCTVPNHVILVRRNGMVIWSGNCFGARQMLSDLYRNVAGIFMNRIMRHEPISIFGEGHKRAFSYIEDSLPAFINAIMENKKFRNDVVFIGGKEEITIDTLLAEILLHFKEYPKPEIVRLPARPLEVKEAYCSVEKSVRLLGYKETIGWKEGIKRMAEWAKQLGSQQWRTEFLPLENDKMPRPWAEVNRR